MTEHGVQIAFMPLLTQRRGPVVRVLGLHPVAPGSNPVLTSGQDLFPVVPDSTLPRFVNSNLITSCQLAHGVLNHVSVKFKLFLSYYQKWSACEVA